MVHACFGSGARPCRDALRLACAGGLALGLAATGFAQDSGGELRATGTVVAATDRAASGAATADDHGATSATATLLAVGATLPGRIDGAGDTDVFRVDLLGRAAVEFRTVGSTDTAGELLDSAGARVVADDDGGPGDNFAMTAELDPGVYYVEVRGDAGDYAVNARLGSAPDHGDTVESSTLLKLHTQDELATVRPQVLLATSGRIYPSTDDTDVFRIDVADGLTDVTVRTSGSVDTYASLTDSSENEVAFADGDGNFRIEQVLDPGIYYVKVRGHGVGAYRVLGSAAPRHDQPPQPVDPPPDDEGDAITGNISECSGRLVGSDVNVTIRGTVTANRSVTDLELMGYANERLIDTAHMGSLAAGSSRSFDIRGSYPYDGVTTLNCRIEVTWSEGGTNGAPDLVVESASVDDDTPDAGESFTLSATVRNRGGARSASTTLRYYRSSNSTISASDTQVGTDSVGGLAASATGDESIRLTAPASAGTYYYGACVDSVAGESDVANNCSRGVEVEVSDDGGGGGTDSYCRDDDDIEARSRCDLYGTSFYFEVENSGRGCLRAGGFTSCSGNRISMRNTTINGVRITFVAAHNDDDSWTIEDVEPEPDD